MNDVKIFSSSFGGLSHSKGQTGLMSHFSDAPCENVFAEPWTVEDLLHEDDIIDKVSLQRLQMLGIKITFCLL